MTGSMVPPQALCAGPVLVDGRFDLQIAGVRGEELLGRRPAGALWSPTVSLDVDSGHVGFLTQSGSAPAIAIADEDPGHRFASFAHPTSLRTDRSARTTLERGLAGRSGQRRSGRLRSRGRGGFPLTQVGPLGRLVWVPGDSSPVDRQRSTQPWPPAWKGVPRRRDSPRPHGEPGREEHRDVAEVGNVNLPLVTREYTGNDQVVGASDQREKAYTWSPRSRAMETSKERRIGAELAANA